MIEFQILPFDVKAISDIMTTHKSFLFPHNFDFEVVKKELPIFHDIYHL